MVTIDESDPKPEATKLHRIGFDLWLVFGTLALWAFVVGPWLKPRLSASNFLVIGEAVFWSCTAIVIVTTLARDRWGALGFRRLSWTNMAISLLAAILLIGLTGLLLALAGQFAPGPIGNANRLKELAALPIAGRVLLLLRAGITEELIFRAHPIERWFSARGNGWYGAVIGLVIFSILHLPGWGVEHTLVVVLPIGGLLTILYMWRRDVVLNMVTHILIDAVPLIVLPLVVSTAS